MSLAEFNQNCRIEGHEERPIHGICVNATCQEQRAICFLCQQLMHQKHRKSDLLDYDKGTKPWIMKRMKEYTKVQSLLSDYLQKIKLCFTNLTKLLEDEFQPAIQLQCLQFEQLNKRINSLISLEAIQQRLQTSIRETVENLLCQLSVDNLLEYSRGREEADQKKHSDNRIMKNHPSSPYNLKGYQLTSKPPPKPSEKKTNITATRIVIKNECIDYQEAFKNNTESNFFTTRDDLKQKSPKKGFPIKLITHNKSSSITMRHKTLPGPPQFATKQF